MSAVYRVLDWLWSAFIVAMVAIITAIVGLLLWGLADLPTHAYILAGLGLWRVIGFIGIGLIGYGIVLAIIETITDLAARK